MNPTTVSPSQSNSEEPGKMDEPSLRVRLVRYMFGIFLTVLALSYAVALVFGYVPEGQRLDLTTLIVIVVAGVCTTLIIKPEMLRRVKRFKVGDLEWEMETLRIRQEKQAEHLNFLSDVLPLLLGEQELTHLRRLNTSDTKYIKGSRDLIKELRKLKELRLIEKPFGKNIGDIKENSPVDIADFVRLTPFGRRWAEKLKEIDAKQVVAADE
jgi:hypothetical protein